MLAFIFGVLLGLFVAWIFESPVQKIKNKIALKRENKKHAKKDKIYKKEGNG